jgi:nitroreductase
MLKTSPLAILVCCDSNLELKKLGVEDCSAATQNILLAAHAKGLGAVWLGLSVVGEETAAIKKLLNLPVHIVPISLISVGYPADQKPRRQRYRVELIHYNRW